MGNDGNSDLLAYFRELQVPSPNFTSGNRIPEYKNVRVIQTATSRGGAHDSLKVIADI